MQNNTNNSTDRKAYIITGPTSGIGRAAAFEVTKQGTAILVGRSLAKLREVQKAIEQKGGHAVSVKCDLSDMESVRRAAAEIVGLYLPIGGLLNNAGISPLRHAKSVQDWDLTCATNYLGAFVLTEALAPHLRDGASIAFVVSAMEDPERKSAKILGMRGSRYISVEASARDEWKQGGSRLPGADAYATSKQCLLAAAMEFARETPRLRVHAVEPGINPGTGLARDASVVLRFLFGRCSCHSPRSPGTGARQNVPLEYLRGSCSTTMAKPACTTTKGKPMLASAQVRDSKFTANVVAETRALLAKAGLTPNKSARPQ